MSYLGDFAIASTVSFTFTTIASDGTPTTLGGTPVLSVYKGAGTTPCTTVLSVAAGGLLVDFASKTGLHNVAIDTSVDGTFYAAGNTFHVVITTGTVGSTSVIGYTVGTFSLQNRYITPTVIENAVWNAATSSHTTAGTYGQASPVIRTGTAVAAAAGTITLDAGASATNSFYDYTMVQITSGTGAGQARLITAYAGATQIATITPNWVTTPDGTSVFVIRPMTPLPVQAGTGTYQIALSSGQVTAGTVSDKTGYSLVAGQLTVKKNVALANFEFLMIDSTDHVTPKTGLTITATRSIDGGVFAACANAASAVSAGIYKISFDDTDLNGDIITFKFTAPGADARYVTVLTQA